jgi:hypothetical protein
MKHDLTTGTWQDDTGCPISIILVSISDVDIVTVTRIVGPLAGAMTNVTMTAPANIVDQYLTVPANDVDPHDLTGIAVPIWRMSNVPPVNVSGMLPNTVTCLPPRYALSAT